MNEPSNRVATVWKQGLFALFLVVVTGVSYLPTRDAGFVWDDDVHIVANETLKDTDGLRRIWLDRKVNTQYYPLVFSTFWVEDKLWGLEPAGYHAFNVLLHAINALLVWLLVRRLSLPGGWIAALVFALHPVHVESVAWVMERKNLLSGMFYLSAALSYLRFRPIVPNVEREPSRGSTKFYWLALIFFACALLSKSVTASLPAVILLVIYWKTGRISLRDIVPLLPLFALAIAAGLNTVWLEKNIVGAGGVDWSFSILERLLIASRALCFYPAKLFWPEPLIFTYPRWHIDSAALWQYVYGIVVLAFFAATWFWRKRIGRGPLVTGLFFAGTLLPALGLLDVYPMRFSFVADHFQYLASLGVIVPLAVATERARIASQGMGGSGLRVLLGTAIVVVLAALAGQTYSQTKIYRDEETLWRHTLDKNPTSWMANNNMGSIHGLRREPEAAAKHFRRAVELKQDYYIAETNLAEALIQLGEYRQAIGHLQHVRQVAPAHADAHYFLWVAHANLAEWDQAFLHLQSHREQKPSFEAHVEAARLLTRAGRKADALREFERAEVFAPGHSVVAFERGNLYLASNDPKRAVDAFLAAIDRQPGWGVAHNRLGIAFEDLGELDKAKLNYAAALEINPNLKFARKNLQRLQKLQVDTQSPATTP